MCAGGCGYGYYGNYNGYGCCDRYYDYDYCGTNFFNNCFSYDKPCGYGGHGYGWRGGYYSWY